MYRQRTFSEVTGQAPHRSLFRDRLRAASGATAVDQWLVEEANLRGWFGATGPSVPERPLTGWLSDERLVVALLMPHGPLDVRLFKLALRIIQSGRLSPSRLWLEARKERAEAVLYWLMTQVPVQEQSAPVRDVVAAQPRPPRGYRPLQIDYDAARLIRQPTMRKTPWRAAQR